MGDVKGKSLKDIGSFMKLPGANLFLTSTEKLFGWHKNLAFGHYLLDLHAVR